MLSRGRKFAIAGVIAGLALLVPSTATSAQVYPPNACQLTLSLGVAVPGQTVIASTTTCSPGFEAGATVTLDLLSEPVFLTTVTANSVGNFSTEITMPPDAALGVHQVRATGPGAGGSELVLFADIELVSAGAAAGGGQLAFTGSDNLPWVWIALVFLALGTAFVIGARRRAQVRHSRTG